MYQNKLQGTLIFKIFQAEHPIPLCRRGAPLQHLTPKGRRYRDEIVLWLLYNFLLLHFFNLKTLVGLNIIQVSLCTVSSPVCGRRGRGERS